MKWYFSAPLLLALGVAFYICLGAYRLLPISPGFGYSEPGDWMGLAAWCCAYFAGVVSMLWHS